MSGLLVNVVFALMWAAWCFTGEPADVAWWVFGFHSGMAIACGFHVAGERQ